MFLDVIVGAAVAHESQEKEARHVKSGHPRSEETDNPEQEEAVEGLAKNFIFAEKSGEGKNSGDREGGDSEGPRSIRNLLPQAAHLADVLFSGHGVDDTAGAEEQEGFEEGMGHQVKDYGSEGADA